MHSPNPRPIVSIFILFTKLFSCFLCVLVIFFFGTSVAVLWFSLFLRSPPVFGLQVLFPSDCRVCYWRLLCPTPPLHHHAYTRTHHHFYPSISVLPHYFWREWEIVVPRSSSRVQNPITPYSFYSQSSPTPLLCLSRRFHRCP